MKRTLRKSEFVNAILESIKKGIENAEVLSSLSDDELYAKEQIQKLGEYNVIEIKNAPPRFQRYIKIEKNIYHDFYEVGWDFNYGYPRKTERFQDPIEVVHFLKNNNIDLYSLKVTINPFLTNGL